MRPQQNRRMRGRSGNNNSGSSNNGGRKGPNPLTRSYESNGPDVKIRGSAQQIAEKYTTLGRDAQSSGDRVMAENYLQHAEHYNRIIMAAQAQMPQPQARDARDDDDIDEDGEEGIAQANANAQQPAEQPAPRQEHQGRRERAERTRENRDDGTGPQPVIEGVPAEVALNQDAESQTASAAPEPAAQAEPAAEAEAEAPRKPRRPRRPRVKAGEEAPASNDDQPAAGSDEPVTEAAQ